MSFNQPKVKIMQQKEAVKPNYILTLNPSASEEDVELLLKKLADSNIRVIKQDDKQLKVHASEDATLSLSLEDTVMSLVPLS